MTNSSEILIVDYQSGNKRAIENMIQRCGFRCRISSAKEDILKASALVLPGVGAFDHVVQNIHKAGLWEILDETVRVKQVPTLGLCVGFQIFAHRSDEGKEKGFGWIDGEVVRLQPDPQRGIRVPNMGWHILRSERSSALIPDPSREQRLYFAHSYHVRCEDESAVSASIDLNQPVTAILEKGNLYGVQGHPEKSHLFGMELFKNFAHASNIVNEVES